jgi:hypothetical protein
LWWDGELSWRTETLMGTFITWDMSWYVHKYPKLSLGYTKYPKLS